MQRPARAGGTWAGLVFIYMVHGTHATFESGKNNSGLVKKHHSCFLFEGTLERRDSPENSEALTKMVCRRTQKKTPCSFKDLFLVLFTA